MSIQHLSVFGSIFILFMYSRFAHIKLVEVMREFRRSRKLEKILISLRPCNLKIIYVWSRLFQEFLAVHYDNLRKRGFLMSQACQVRKSYYYVVRRVYSRNAIIKLDGMYHFKDNK